MSDSTAVHDRMEIIRRRAAAYGGPAKVNSTVQTRVIKENDLFLLTDPDGGVPRDNKQGLGLYLRDTRFLSTYELRLNGQPPVVLYSTSERNCLLSADLTNPNMELDGQEVRNTTITINRSILVYNAVYERITFINYGKDVVDLPVSLDFAADFRDIFEVRGYKTRERRGEMLPTEYSAQAMTLAYRGLDDVVRRTHVRFLEKPDVLSEQTARFTLHLEPRAEVTIGVQIAPQEGDEEREQVSYVDARNALETSYTSWLQQNTLVGTTSDLFDEMFQRSVLDLRLLLLDTEWGPVPSAGTPWFACAFGRDSLISALQSLIFCPDLARGTLRLLAQYQGREVNHWREEEPGKIFHEMRRGERARLREVPYTPYYGTADATPLWLVLLAETFRWTGDRELVDELWAPALLALEWIDRYGDLDGDGYVEYVCNSFGETVNHGWKDSANSMFHADGELAEQPIALVEVQGYVYAAKRGLAELCDMRGETEMAARLRREADELRSRFNRDFWVEERGFLAFALDAHKNQVKTVTSNPGHALWAGIVDPDLARRMVPRFKRSDLLSGWGVRCVSDTESGYNPMGYHLGTVWPFDVSLLVAGLRRYGFDRDALTIATQLYRAGLQFVYHRFPEVFTGIARTHNPFPVPYPVACSPQAWSAGVPLLLLQTIVGIVPEAGKGRVTLNPALPSWLNEVRLSNLRVGDAVLDLRFSLHGEHSTAQVLSRSGSVEVMI